MTDDPAIRCHTCTRWGRLPETTPPQHAVFGRCGLRGERDRQALRSAFDTCGKHEPRLATPDITVDTPVWDIPSGMGGAFTVTLLNDDPASAEVTARVCYGRLREDGSYERWLDWDGYTFTAPRSELANPRRFGDPSPRRAR